MGAEYNYDKFVKKLVQEDGKLHKCSKCKQTFEIGEEYITLDVAKINRKPYKRKFHYECGYEQFVELCSQKWFFRKVVISNFEDRETNYGYITDFFYYDVLKLPKGAKPPIFINKGIAGLRTGSLDNPKIENKPYTWKDIADAIRSQKAYLYKILRDKNFHTDYARFKYIHRVICSKLPSIHRINENTKRDIEKRIELNVETVQELTPKSEMDKKIENYKKQRETEQKENITSAYDEMMKKANRKKG